MYASRSLLERLEQPGAEGSREFGINLERLRDSVLRNLQRVLNSAHGGSVSAADFGIPSFADYFRDGGSLAQLQQAIATAVAHYEPRLSNIEVNFESTHAEQTQLRFDIVATIVAEGHARPTVFRSVVEPSGHVAVKHL